MLKFEAQPIMNVADGQVFGYELLYRGSKPLSWPEVDAALLSYLRTRHAHPRLFVKISNKGLLAALPAEISRAARANDIIFELSESSVEDEEREMLSMKANSVIGSGIRVAVDDFGAGRDSLERLYSLDRTTAVKIDRLFLQLCARRPDAAEMLGHLVIQWRRAGIWTIAEGIETPALLEFAKSLGVDKVQGWHVDTLVSHIQSSQGKR